MGLKYDFNRPISICIFCDCASWSGVWSYTCRLGTELRKHGFNIILVSLQARSETERSIAEAFTNFADEIYWVSRSDNEKHRIAELVDYLKQIKPDIFIPNYRIISYASYAYASKILSTKVVGICHNDHESYYSLLCRFAPIIEGFICPSQKTYQELQRRLPGRIKEIVHIPHGIMIPNERKACFSGGEIRLIYHGRLSEEQKNVSYLLKVAEKLKERSVPFKLELIGDGLNAADYLNYIKNKHLNDCVEIQKGCSWQILLKKLENAHIAVLASKYEGFCLSLAEAMAFGLPGIAFNSGGVIEEYLKDSESGFIVPWGDVSMMAQKIQLLQSKPQEWNNFSIAARSAIRDKFSMTQFGKNYSDYLLKIFHSGKNRAWPRLLSVFPPKRKNILLYLLYRLIHNYASKK